VTLYYSKEGGRLVVDKVVMAKPEDVVERSTEDPGIRTHTDGGVSYVTGGTGKDEREALPALAKGDNLKLVFALQSAEPHRPLVNNVSVQIRDRAGREILGVSDAGPLLFARVPDGTYEVAATVRGRTLTQTAKVVEGRQTQLAFYWYDRARGTGGSRSRARAPHASTTHGMTTHGAFASPNLIQRFTKREVSTLGIPPTISLR